MTWGTDWYINWDTASDKEKADYAEAVMSYTPMRPGYIWDHGWHKIPGYDDINLHDIVDIAQVVWGGRTSFRYGHDVPCRQNRKGKPKGKWRKNKRISRELFGDGSWYMSSTTEMGRHVNTRIVEDEHRRFDT